MVTCKVATGIPGQEPSCCPSGRVTIMGEKSQKSADVINIAAEAGNQGKRYVI
jgi:hypothetical protein